MTKKEKKLYFGIWFLAFMCASLLFGSGTLYLLEEQKEVSYELEISNMANHIVNLEKVVSEKESKIKKLEEESVYLLALNPLVGLVSDDDIKLLIDIIPRGNPFEENFRVTSSFGESTGFFPRTKHKGIDISPRIPESMSWQIYAFAPGEVVSYGISRDYGKNIVIEHSDRIRTRYAHLSKIYYTGTTGEKVTAETRIGVMGSTGHSTAAHLHFEILIKTNEDKWVQIDPKPYLLQIPMDQ